MKNWKKMIVTAAAFGALALLAGCTTASAVSLEEAKDLVKDQVGDPTAVVIEQETDRDDGVYELEIVIEGVAYDFEVDSRTGEIREVDRENDRPAAETQPAAPAETQPAQTQPKESKSEGISAEEALSIALNHAGVTDARDRDVEWDDGRWEVSFEHGCTDYEYHISAEGKILRWEKDHDD